MKPKEKIEKATVQLLLDEPFFATLLLYLQRIEVPNLNPPTMATDGKRLLYHPGFVDSLDVAEIKTVLVHEVLHCAFLHMARRGSRDPKKWNYATDYAINGEIDKINQAKGASSNPPFPWPKGFTPLLDRQYDGMSAEEIYNKLPDSPKGGKGKGKGKGGFGAGQGATGEDSEPDSSGFGEVLDAESGTEAETETEWQLAVAQAAQAAKMQGKLPANLERFVQDLLNPKVPWQDRLKHLIREVAKDDYCWHRPNTRYLHTGFVLPSLYSQRMGKLVVAIDTSGSICGDLLSRFMAEVETIAHECKPSSIVIIDCDAQVNSIREVDPCDPLPRDFKGGGGTRFVPVFEQAPDDAVCLIYFTDLYGTFPENAPNYPVIWAVYGNDGGQAPWGETLHVE